MCSFIEFIFGKKGGCVLMFIGLWELYVDNIVIYFVYEIFVR